MRKLLFVLLCLLFVSQVADAQIRRKKIRRNYVSRMQRVGEFSYTGSVGISTYFGDLKQSYDLWAKPSLGLGVNYRAGRHITVRGEVNWYRISGADSLNEARYTIYDRNLSFRSDNFEVNVAALYYLFNKYSRTNRPILNPYVFAGIGFTTNNPKALYEGEWVNLRKLQTEGVSYSSVLLTTPVGLGLSYHNLFPGVDVSIEGGMRYVFSDYLDDVSTVYKEESTFENPLAYELSDRRDEFIERTGREPRNKSMNYRGNPSNKDWYFISALKVTYVPGLPQQQRFKRAKFQMGR